MRKAIEEEEEEELKGEILKKSSLSRNPIQFNFFSGSRPRDSTWRGG